MKSKELITGAIIAGIMTIGGLAYKDEIMGGDLIIEKIDTKEVLLAEYLNKEVKPLNNNKAISLSEMIVKDGGEVLKNEFIVLGEKYGRDDISELRSDELIILQKMNVRFSKKDNIWTVYYGDQKVIVEDSGPIDTHRILNKAVTQLKNEK